MPGPGHDAAMHFGVKAALGDAWEMAGLEVEFLEVHLCTGDLARHRDALVRTFRGVTAEWGHGIVVHAPEFMSVSGSSALVDIASPDPTVRDMSVAELEAALELAQDVDATLMVAHPGGIRPGRERTGEGGGVDPLLSSLPPLSDRAREAGVALTLENMPWYYHWKVEGTDRWEDWHSTVMVETRDLARLLPLVDGLTLDISHAFLHCPAGGMDVIDQVVTHHADRVLHLHISDALPPDHEGLQIGEGAVDMEGVMRAFWGRDLTAVPEILGGHMGGGVGFRRALAELRRMEATLHDRA